MWLFIEYVLTQFQLGQDSWVLFSFGLFELDAPQATMHWLSGKIAVQVLSIGLIIYYYFIVFLNEMQGVYIHRSLLKKKKKKLCAFHR